MGERRGGGVAIVPIGGSTPARKSPVDTIGHSWSPSRSGPLSVAAATVAVSLSTAIVAAATTPLLIPHPTRRQMGRQIG